jgi:1,4-alpha-glucan branching enzyme
MIKKRKLPNNKYSVTFSMPALEGVAELFLVGEFNQWDQSGTPMARDEDGAWSVKLTLEAGRDYQYRYRDSNNTWHNDWAPDAYVRNEHGGDNSLISLINGVKEEPVKKAAAKKKKAM